MEIAKSLVRGARILVLDEPTATLTPRETDGLFRALRSMAERGMGVIFISHKLGEVIEITTRITVMRHGKRRRRARERRRPVEAASWRG